MFLQRNTCCLLFVVTNIITNMFHNYNRLHSLYWAYAQPEGHQKGVDNQDKTEVALFMSIPFSHTSA